MLANIGYRRERPCHNYVNLVLLAKKYKRLRTRHPDYCTMEDRGIWWPRALDNRYRMPIIHEVRGHTLPVSRLIPSRLISRVEEASVGKEGGIVLPLASSTC